MVGSLTGAVSSKRVTEEYEGALSAVGHRAMSIMVEVRLTARQTRRAGAKAGHSDPVVLSGRAIAQRIKGTPGFDSGSERTLTAWFRHASRTIPIYRGSGK